MKGRKQLWVSADEQMLLQEYRKLRDHIGYKVAPEHHMAMKLFLDTLDIKPFDMEANRE